MKINKKIGFSLLLGLSILSVSCNNGKTEEKNILTAPKIALSDSGVLTWSMVDYADTYNIWVDNELAFVSSGYSYEINKSSVGDYPVYVIASDSNKLYEDSPKSNLQIYHVKHEKLSTPAISFDGENIVWKAIEHADDYVIYADGEKIVNPVLITKENRIFYKIANPTSKTSKIEVKAISTTGNYRDSDISNYATYIDAGEGRRWNANQVDDEWDKENEVCIQHIIEPEILVWVDQKGSSPASFENYVSIPNNSKSFAITGYRHDPYGACNITLEMKKFDEEEYQVITYQTYQSAKFSDSTQATYYWQLPTKFQSGTAFIKVSMESSGAYQARFVLRYLSFETETHYVAPKIPTNKGVTLTSVSLNKMLKFDTNKGYMTLAEDNDNPGDVAIKFVEDTVYGEGFYRMVSQNGLYLTFARFLNDLNGVGDFLIETEYCANLTAQVWMVKSISSIGGVNTFTFQNYGMPDGVDDHGNPQYLVLDIPYGGVDNTTSWHDIDNTDLQFVVTEVDASFPAEGKHNQSNSLDLSKDVIASFAGRNSVFELNASGRYINTSKLISSIEDLTPYAWKFEKVNDDYYRIKNGNGKYLKAILDSGVYHIIEDNYAENNDAFLWKINSMSGYFFYLASKFVDSDSHFNQYLCMNPDGLLGFYTDLCNHGDQILRIKNM